MRVKLYGSIACFIYYEIYIYIYVVEKVTVRRTQSLIGCIQIEVSIKLVYEFHLFLQRSFDIECVFELPFQNCLRSMNIKSSDFMNELYRACDFMMKYMKN